jgi:hypothetical protein
MSNWTGLDVRRYTAEEMSEVPSICIAHEWGDDLLVEAAIEDRKRQGYF